MTHLSSTRQNTARNYYNTSTIRTHTSSSQWNLNNRAHFLSWTLSSPSNQTTHSAPQYTENPPIQINTYTGTATTTSQPNKVCSRPWHIGPRQFPLHKTAWIRNGSHQNSTQTLPVPILGPQPMAPQVHPISTTFQQPPQPSNNNSSTDNNKTKATIVVPYIGRTSETFKKSVQKQKESKFILRAQTLSGQHWATLRTRTLNQTRQASSTTINAYTSTATAPT